MADERSPREIRIVGVAAQVGDDLYTISKKMNMSIGVFLKGQLGLIIKNHEHLLVEERKKKNQ